MAGGPGEGGYYAYEGGGEAIEDFYGRLSVVKKKASSGSETSDGSLSDTDRLRWQASQRSRDVIQ